MDEPGEIRYLMPDGRSVYHVRVALLLTDEWQTMWKVNDKVLRIINSSTRKRCFGTVDKTVEALNELEAEGWAERRVGPSHFVEWRRRRCRSRSRYARGPSSMPSSSASWSARASQASLRCGR